MAGAGRGATGLVALLHAFVDEGGRWQLGALGHCAASEPMIEAGDQLGIMAEQPGVDGESDTVGAAWKIRAAAFRDLIIYFRNHPSIMIWRAATRKFPRARQGTAQLHGEYIRTADGLTRTGARQNRRAIHGCVHRHGRWTRGALTRRGGEYDREESPRRVWDEFSPPNFGYPESEGKIGLR